MSENSGGVIERAASVLLAVAQGEGGTTIRELADNLGLSKSSVQRMLASLERTGLLAMNPESCRYVRGPRLLELAARIAQPLVSVQAAARPVMLDLLRQTDETVALHTTVGDERMILLQFEGSQALRYAGSLDQLYPLDRGAASRALLIAGDARSANEVVVSKGERVEGIVGLAVPINWDGASLSLGLSIPAARANDALLERFSSALRDSKSELEARLNV